MPSIDIQTKIVAECESIDVMYTKAQKMISDAKAQVEVKVSETFSKGYELRKLSDSHVSQINPSRSEIKTIDEDTLVSFVEMASVSELGLITHKVDRPLKELRKGSYTYFAENDIIIAKITPCMENGKCALAKGLTHGIAMGSSEFRVIRPNQKNILPEYLFALLNRQIVRTEAEKVMTGSSGHRRVPASFYENYSIPVPSIFDQKAIVTEIEKLEQTIAEAQAVIAAAPAQKQAIMKKYL